MQYVFAPVRQTSPSPVCRECWQWHVLSRVPIQYVPAVRRCNIIRLVSVTLFLYPCSLGSQSISAAAVPIFSRGSCSWASDGVAFGKKKAVLERGREGTILRFAIRIGWRGVFLVPLYNVNSHLAKYTSLLLTLSLAVFTHLSLSVTGAAAKQD